MTCESMLELMLEADPAELRGVGTSVLAAHVHECARCQRVAGHLLVESQLLAVSVRRSGVVEIGSFAARTRFPRRAMIGGSVVAVAASLVLFVLAEHASKQRADYESSPSVAHAAMIIPNGVGPPRPGMPGDGRAEVPAESRSVYEPRTAPVVGRRFADATAVVAVPLTSVNFVRPAPVMEEPAMVRVDPPAGMRATVMQTSNPRITVVLLYKPSSGSEK